MLKAIARNALIHSFLPAADRQRELARFDRSSVEFERSITGAGWPFRDLAILLKAAVMPPP
jgi:hypothetical protein